MLRRLVRCCDRGASARTRAHTLLLVLLFWEKFWSSELSNQITVLMLRGARQAASPCAVNVKIVDALRLLLHCKGIAVERKVLGVEELSQLLCGSLWFPFVVRSKQDSSVARDFWREKADNCQIYSAKKTIHVQTFYLRLYELGFSVLNPERSSFIAGVASLYFLWGRGL